MEILSKDFILKRNVGEKDLLQITHSNGTVYLIYSEDIEEVKKILQLYREECTYPDVEEICYNRKRNIVERKQEELLSLFQAEPPPNDEPSPSSLSRAEPLPKEECQYVRKIVFDNECFIKKQDEIIEKFGHISYINNVIESDPNASGLPDPNASGLPDPNASGLPNSNAFGLPDNIYGGGVSIKPVQDAVSQPTANSKFDISKYKKYLPYIVIVVLFGVLIYRENKV